jgi:hypothetical protein
MNTHRKTRMGLKSAKGVVGGADFMVFFPFPGSALTASGDESTLMVPLFIVANLARLCHKRNLIARLIKGCRVDVRAGCFVLRKT